MNLQTSRFSLSFTASSRSFRSAASIIFSAEISEQQPLALPYNQLGWFQTVAGDALNIGEDAGSATLVFGHLVVVKV